MMTNDEIINLMKNEYDINIKSIEKSNESTDGNVYILYAMNEDIKYVVKIYDDIKHVESMVKLHTYLKEYNLLAPDVIKNNRNELYTKVNDNKYIVCYSFINGSKISEVQFTNDGIKVVAEYLRKLHTIKENEFNLKNVPFNVNSDRYSVIHFDVTKHNIFIDKENKIYFIDFDDAKFGPSVCDVAIAITNLFISKAHGADVDGINWFINSYYKEDRLLKEKELPIIKEAALKWLNLIINNPNFDTSTKEGLQNKIEQTNKILG